MAQQDGFGGGDGLGGSGVLNIFGGVDSGMTGAYAFQST